jgi:hypothetical protein
MESGIYERFRITKFTVVDDGNIFRRYLVCTFGYGEMEAMYQE